MCDLNQLVRSSVAVLLDFDGPVCHLYAGHPASQVAARLRVFLHDRGVTLPDQLTDNRDPLEVLRWSSMAYPDLTASVEDLLRAEEAVAARSAEPTAYAADVVETVSRTGKLVGIVSNNGEPAIRQYLALHVLPVDVVVGRAYADPDRMKPDPAPVAAAVAELGVAPADCLLIGDSPSDIAAARAAHLHGVGYAKPPTRQAGLIEAGAEVVIHSMNELVRALRSAVEG
jgi:HAD superfamily hydrolase (TIGR01509 family)